MEYNKVMEPASNDPSLPKEEQNRHSIIERQFVGVTPEEKVNEVYGFIEELGLSPNQALIRIFNGGLIIREILT